MRGGAGFHADQAGGQRGEIGDDLSAPQAALEDHLACPVHAMDLEDLLGQVEADRCNLHLDGSPWCCSTATTLA
jgi:hypothetical protein